MDFMRIIDTIPQAFDRLRPRYSEAAFADLFVIAGLSETASVLEIGPGTGQATEPILKTGADYLDVELGRNFTAFLKNKFRNYPNFHIVNADFEPHNFGKRRLIASCPPTRFNGFRKKSGFRSHTDF